MSLMSLNELVQFLQALQSGAYIPYQEWGRYEPVVTRLNVHIEIDLGPGEVGYQPIKGFYVKPL